MIPNYRKPRKKGQFVIPGQTKITAFVTCSYQPHTTHTPRFPPPTKHAPSRQTQLSPSCQTQSSISPFVTTIHKASDPMTPKKLRHSSPVLSMSPLNLHLLLSPSTASSPLPLLSSSSPSLSPQIKTKLTQTTLTKYFLIKPKQQQQTGPLLQPSSPKPIGPTKHHRKIQYKYHLPRNQPLISNFTVAYPKPDLQDTWGHSLMEIDLCTLLESSYKIQMVSTLTPPTSPFSRTSKHATTMEQQLSPYLRQKQTGDFPTRKPCCMDYYAAFGIALHSKPLTLVNSFSPTGNQVAQPPLCVLTGPLVSSTKGRTLSASADGHMSH